MDKKELKKVFNLNSYEWWRNHRRVVTFGGFLILFAWYISPVIKEAAYKNRCIEIAEARILFSLKEENRNQNLKEATGVSIAKIAEMEAYKNCNNNYEVLKQ